MVSECLWGDLVVDDCTRVLLGEKEWLGVIRTDDYTVNTGLVTNYIWGHFALLLWPTVFLVVFASIKDLSRSIKFCFQRMKIVMTRVS